MHRNVIILYKSVTGFTREYAEMAARETGCTLMELKKATLESLSGYDTVVFGGRLHAGKVDGLKRAKELFRQSGASQLLIFATGATPGEAAEVIEEMWRNNLSPEELTEIPHFYMRSGLRYEGMSFSDKMMMRVFSYLMKKKKVKSEFEQQAGEMLSGSFDLSSEAYCRPLIAALKTEKDSPG